MLSASPHWLWCESPSSQTALTEIKREMALEAVVFPTLDPFSYGCKGGGGWGYDFGLQQQQGKEEEEEEEDKALLGTLDGNYTEQPGPHGNWEYSSSPSLMQNVTATATAAAAEWDHNSSPEVCTADQSPPSVFPLLAEDPPSTSTSGRRKRRRTKTCKNKEEVENQRMTHIAVERNRRKQMNEYLAVLRSLMPPSYIQRGDQASIIGGAINFVKELEQLLQSLEAQKGSSEQESAAASYPFSDFFSFPQYSTRAITQGQKECMKMGENRRAAAADIEVTMVESHANIKILSKRRNKQLLKMAAGFQSLCLTILHLNVTTTFDQMVLYSLSVKVEEECQLTTVDEIAAAVNQMLGRIQDQVAA